MDELVGSHELAATPRADFAAIVQRPVAEVLALASGHAATGWSGAIMALVSDRFPGWRGWMEERRPLSGVLVSIVLVALVTAAIALLKQHVPVLSLGVLYILTVLPIAIGWGMAYAIAVAVASILAFNFFFLPPLYTLTIADSRNWFALLVEPSSFPTPTRAKTGTAFGGGAPCRTIYLESPRRRGAAAQAAGI